MLKIFSTQLSGYFKKIAGQEDEIEDGARLLAQALTGDGTIYIHGTKEMAGVMLEALYGEEPLQGAQPLFTDGKQAELRETDRVLLISRFSTDAEAATLAEQLQGEGHFVVSISTAKEGAPSLTQFSDVHIDLKLLKGLVPNEDGSRSGYPGLLLALFAYFGLKFTIDEMMAEYADDSVEGLV